MADSDSRCDGRCSQGHVQCPLYQKEGGKRHLPSRFVAAYFLLNKETLSGDLKLVTLGFHGMVIVQQRIEQSSTAHETFFLAAANWMVKHQDKEVRFGLSCRIDGVVRVIGGPARWPLPSSF